MTHTAFPPIRYSRREASLMIRIVQELRPGMKATTKTLGLVQDGKGFLLTVGEIEPQCRSCGMGGSGHLGVALSIS